MSNCAECTNNCGVVDFAQTLQQAGLEITEAYTRNEDIENIDAILRKYPECMQNMIISVLGERGRSESAAVRGYRPK